VHRLWPVVAGGLGGDALRGELLDDKPLTPVGQRSGPLGELLWEVCRLGRQLGDQGILAGQHVRDADRAISWRVQAVA